MKIQIESIIDKKELLAINTIIANVPNGDLEQTYNHITEANNQAWNIQKAELQTGMGANHIWVANKVGDRILIITE
jgi:hypothetical protein